jgi:membrane associated rhomboid family serine protease
MNYFQSRGPFANIPPVVKNLLMINAVMLLATYIMGDVMYEKLGLFYPASPLFKPYQFITHMFMHGNFVHLFFNMYALFIFGCALEYVWGSKRFFIFFIATGIGAGIIQIFAYYIQIQIIAGGLAPEAMDIVKTEGFQLLQNNQNLTGSLGQLNLLYNVSMVGASGAIYGVLLGYGMLFPNNVLQLLFPPIALKAKWFVLIFGALELFLGLSGRGGNVAHFAHLGGMIFAFILIRFWKKKKKMYF